MFFWSVSLGCRHEIVIFIFLFLKLSKKKLQKKIYHANQFEDSDLVDFLSGSADSAINFSGSADLHTPIQQQGAKDHSTRVY